MKKRSLILWAFVCLLLPNFVQAQTLLWEISGKDMKKPSYLFGTYHLIKDEYLKKHPKVEEKLNKAKAIMVEINEDSAAMVQATIAAAMMKDNALTNLLDSADYALVGHEIKTAMGYPLQAFNQFKPSFISIMLSTVYNQKLNPELNEYKGTMMDMYFIKKAKADKKPVLALETIQEQLSMLYDHQPLEEQAKHLVTMVKDKDKMISAQKELLASYLTQDFKRMLSLSTELSKEYGDTSYMLDDRNQRWIPAIEKAVKEQSTFIAVGALHLPGENGVIELLRKQGYTVKPIM